MRKQRHSHRRRRSTLSILTTGRSTLFIAQGLRREVEDLVATLVIQPVQPKFWAVGSTIDVLWRAPACFLFVLFMGEWKKARVGIIWYADCKQMQLRCGVAAVPFCSVKRTIQRIKSQHPPGDSALRPGSRCANCTLI